MLIIKIKSPENPFKTKTRTLTFLKYFLVVCFLFLSVLVVTQAWWRHGYFFSSPLAGLDSPFHAYGVWFVSEKLKAFDFFFDFDFTLNQLFSRSFQRLSYFLIAPFSLVFGLLEGISFYVVLLYFVASLGFFVLARHYTKSYLASLLGATAFITGYGFTLASQVIYGVHRFLPLALFAWIVYCFERRNEKKFFVLCCLLLAISILSHILVVMFILTFLGFLSFFRIISESFNIHLKKRRVTFIFKGISLKSIFRDLAIIIIPFLIVGFHFIPFIYEVYSHIFSSNVLSTITDAGVEAALSSIKGLFERNFVENSEFTRTTFYLGSFVVFLSLFSIFSFKRTVLKYIPILLFFVLFNVYPGIFPDFFRSRGGLRALPFINFSFAILCSFSLLAIFNTIDSIFVNYKRYSSKIIKYCFFFFFVFLLFFDLYPSFTAMDSQPYDTMYTRRFYSNLSVDGRLAYYDLNYNFMHHAQFSPHPMIGVTAELQNREYNNFLHNNTFLMPGTNNTLYNSSLLGLRLLNIDKMLFLNKPLGGYFRMDSMPDALPAFQSAKTVLLNFSSKTEANAYFLNNILLNMAQTDLTKVLFIYPEYKYSADFDLVVNKKNAFNFDFSNLPFGTIINYSVKDNKLLINNLRKGWLFVSLMWWPNWHAYGEDGTEFSVYECEGGLTCVYLTKNVDTLIIKWVKPWYDYASWALSIAALALLILYLFNPFKFSMNIKIV